MKKKSKTVMGAPVRLPDAENRVAVVRRLYGVSQEKFAELLGCSRGLVSMMERGLGPIMPQTAKILDMLEKQKR